MNVPTIAEDPRAELYRRAVSSLLKLLLGFGLFAGALSLVAWAFRDELERVGGWFVGQFGVIGMGFGTFLADGFHFPVPPQFYLITTVAGHASQLASVTGIVIGSLLGGLVAFTAGRKLSGFEVLERWSRAPRRLLQDALDRHGTWGLVVAGLMPLSYWLLCVMGGVLRLPYTAYGVIALTRIPRLLLTYAIVRLALGQ